jgi:Putative zinc-finger
VDDDTPAVRHPDPEELAAQVEGLLPPQAAASVSAHLAACARCREDAAALAALPQLLASAARPRIPDDVALRLHRALAAAAPPTAGGPEGAVVPIRATRRRVRWPQPTGMVARAAAAILLVGGGVLGWQLLTPDRDSAIERTTAAGGQEETSGRSRDSALPEAGAAGGPPRLLATGRDYTSAGLVTEAARLLAAVEVAAPAPRAAPQPMASAAVPVQACLDALGATAAGPPLAVDVARFRARPAAVVLLPVDHAAGSQGGSARVLVLTRPCRGVPADVLATATVPR